MMIRKRVAQACARWSVKAVVPVVALTCLAPEASRAQITYAKDVAPIIQENCQECHRPGSIGPMSLLTYEQAKAFAPLIKQRVVDRIMPPWHVDKEVGIQAFKNDISLSDEEIQTIASWVDAGAPLGNPSDLPPPREFPAFSDDWQFAKVYGRPPDLVIQNPPFRLPAHGEDQWWDTEAPLQGLDDERYMMAIEAKPANPETRYVFHHGGPSLRQDGESTGLMNSPAGKVGEMLPDDAGKLFKPDATVSYSFHLFPIGKEVDVVMQWGVWFYPKGERPKYETPGEEQVRAHHGHCCSSRAYDLILPPNSTAMLRGVRVLDQNTRIHSIRPHMHLRGKYQTVEAIYPDGRREVINKINFQHRWHTAYTYEEWARPLLPKGTVLITTSWFDNTPNQESNPDPNQWVTYGQRTVDDMSHMWIGMTYIPDEDFNVMVEERERRLKEVNIAQGMEP